MRHYLREGGLKLSPEHRSELNPQTVIEVEKKYLKFIRSFNDWLQNKGHEPVVPVGLTGSATYAPKDSQDEKRSGVTYGDVDYLVSFPVQYTSEDLGSRRKQESESLRVYTDLMRDYMVSSSPPEVDTEKTLKSNPLMVIIRLPGEKYVQVDTVVTHPPYQSWMRGRYTPERGVKGYVTGNLYKALGDYLTLTIGTEGVIARYKDGSIVSSKVRSGVSFKNVSTNFRSFLMDIAQFMTKGEFTPDSLLSQHPGMDPENVSVSSLARGIVGLARTLESEGIVSASEMLSTIYDSFVSGLEENVGRKISRDITQSQQEKLLKINQDQSKIVKDIFSGA